MRRVARPVSFHVLFWMPFWLVPVLVLAGERWPDVGSADFVAWARQGVVLTAAMMGAAEVWGRWRRAFLLLSALVLWVGASLSIAFVSATGIRENAFSALTGIVYAAPDLAGMSFVPWSWLDAIAILAVASPFIWLACRWQGVGWRPSWARVVACGMVCVTITAARVLWHDYGGGRLDGAARLDTLGTITDPALPISVFVTIARALPLAREMMLNPDRPAPRVTVEGRTRPLTLIVIVGESTGRRHMSLYGYCRPTTPALDARADELFTFRDVISAIPLTVFALSHGLRVSLESPGGRQKQSVFDVLHAAGFHTYWLSNQYDAPGDPIASMTSLAEHRVMTYGTGAKQGGGRQSVFDEALLPELDRVLADSRGDNVIFMHTIGNHSYYEERVPPAFTAERFRGGLPQRDTRRADVINAYDNAVRYADFVVAETIARAEHQGGDVAVLYVSDHGDEVLDAIDFAGHRYPRSTPAMVEIPLVVWLSPQLRVHNPSLASDLASALTRRLDIDDLSPLVFDVAGISVEGLPEERHPLSPRFASRQRMVGAIDYDVDRTLGIARQLPSTCP